MFCVLCMCTIRKNFASGTASIAEELKAAAVPFDTSPQNRETFHQVEWTGIVGRYSIKFNLTNVGEWDIYAKNQSIEKKIDSIRVIPDVVSHFEFVCNL